MRCACAVQKLGNCRTQTTRRAHGLEVSTLGARGGRLRGSQDANYPCPPPPPPPLGAFGQQLVAKGVALRRPWAPKAPDAP